MQEGSDGTFEVLFRKGEYFGKLFAGMFAQQFKNLVIVGALHQLFQRFVAFFFLFALFIHDLAADQHEYGEADKGDDGNGAAEVNQHCYEKQMVKAAPAVMNHPPMTLNTPVMRNTAESRPQARSASEVPIATMNVT